MDDTAPLADGLATPPSFATPMAALAAAKVLSLDGKPVRLRDAFGARPTVLALVRQFGCLFCHELVAELVTACGRFEERGAHVVIVGCGTVEQAAKFGKHKGLPRSGVTLLTDPERTSFEAGQLPRSWVATFLHPGAWEAFGRAKASGHKIVGAFGDVPQLGGVFVVKPPAALVFEHRSRFAGDHPDVDTLLGVVSGLNARA